MKWTKKGPVWWFGISLVTLMLQEKINRRAYDKMTIIKNRIIKCSFNQMHCTAQHSFSHLHRLSIRSFVRSFNYSSRYMLWSFTIILPVPFHHQGLSACNEASNFGTHSHKIHKVNERMGRLYACNQIPNARTKLEGKLMASNGCYGLLRVILKGTK